MRTSRRLEGDHQDYDDDDGGGGSDDNVEETEEAPRLTILFQSFLPFSKCRTYSARVSKGTFLGHFA